jgi:trimeric autotransporter adhesin
MKKNILMISFIAFSSTMAAQNVGIGIATPNTSAQLDITSTSKGMLIPRMKTSSITAISNPARGLLVYDSANNQLMVNMGSPSLHNWQTIVAKSGWGLTGNSGSNPANNFLGTTDDQPLQFRINNQFAGIIDSANGLTFLGYGAGKNITGRLNTAIGFKSLYLNTDGVYNTANGDHALFSNTTGSNNTANGVHALISNSTGSDNTANGASALLKNNESYNTACGSEALFNTTASQYNVALGYHAGYNYDNGYNNVFLGANTSPGGPGYYNDIAIGLGVICTDVSQAKIGNSATASIGGYVDWSNLSDERYKKNMQQNVPGLAFVNLLKPITYTLDVNGIEAKLHEHDKAQKTPDGKALPNPMDNAFMKQAMDEKSKIVYTGFAAQEVALAAQSIGYNFSGVDKPKDDQQSFYGLRYGEFVVPLVKAVQELSEQTVAEKKIIEQQQEKINDLEKRMEAMEKIISKQ